MQERNPGKDRHRPAARGTHLAPCDSPHAIPGDSSRAIPGDSSRVIQSVVEGSRRKEAVPGHQRKISVGILEADRVEFSLGGETVFVATECDGQVVIDGEARPEWYFAEGCARRADRAAGADNVDNQKKINNASPDSVGEHFGEIAKNETVTLQSKQYFTLKNVEIGKGFHWQRYQDQSFPGDLKLIARHGRVIAINVVGIEDYLQCVIAS
ncbi:MAG: hypothetical protein IJS70_04600, partial [Bacteroidales bacterium]|nr:hypothetical protein [Bacteroidales bacterium]